MRTKQETEQFLRELNLPESVLECIEIDRIDPNRPFESIYEMILENDGFIMEIIYCDNAMEYLSEHDPCLIESLTLAAELGLSITDIDSEQLASLLLSENTRKEFCELQDKIDNFFKD